MKVKIDYVSSRVEKEDLEKLFGKYGRVGDVPSTATETQISNLQVKHLKAAPVHRGRRSICRAIPMATARVSPSCDSTTSRQSLRGSEREQMDAVLSLQDAEDAVKEMEGYELEGKTLKCMLATVQKRRLAQECCSRHGFSDQRHGPSGATLRSIQPQCAQEFWTLEVEAALM